MVQLVWEPAGIRGFSEQAAEPDRSVQDCPTCRIVRLGQQLVRSRCHPLLVRPTPVTEAKAILLQTIGLPADSYVGLKGLGPLRSAGGQPSAPRPCGHNADPVGGGNLNSSADHAVNPPLA